jgi:hypothetical protein
VEIPSSLRAAELFEQDGLFRRRASQARESLAPAQLSEDGPRLAAGRRVAAAGPVRWLLDAGCRRVRHDRPLRLRLRNVSFVAADYVTSHRS